MPQGLILGPVLFNLLICDLISRDVVRFADNTKLFWVVESKRDCEELQNDLFKLGKWVAKCQVHVSVK